jgi:hypothetical protein
MAWIVTTFAKVLVIAASRSNASIVDWISAMSRCCIVCISLSSLSTAALAVVAYRGLNPGP